VNAGNEADFDMAFGTTVQLLATAADPSLATGASHL